MNRKLLLVVLTLAVVLLATPYIGMVSAGKGQSKLDFMFVLVGTYSPPERTVAGGENTMHYWNFPFIATGWADPPTPPVMLVIGGVPISPALLSYSGMMHVNENLKNGGSTIVVAEIISIWADTDHTILRGTLELHVQGQTNQGQGLGAGDNFIGFGTGEFAGVKISGSTPTIEVLGQVPTGQPPPAPEFVPILKLTRVGTVMG